MTELFYSPFFGLTLTFLCWRAGLWCQKKTGWLLCNPLVVALMLIAAVLSVFRIPLDAYARGGDLIHGMLGPVTAVLALKIYRQRRVLQEAFLPVLLGCLAGSVASLISVLALCRLLETDALLTASLLPKSVTTAIAIGIAESRGGVGGIAAAAVILTGMVGALLSPVLAKAFHITDPVAEGLAIGASSHAMGTSRALSIGPVQGAMSSIALCVCGIITSALVLFF